jgi:hypothetical protein
MVAILTNKTSLSTVHMLIILPRLSWNWTLLLPSYTHRKPTMSITGVLLPFVTYLLTVPHTWFEAFTVTVYSEVFLCDQPCQCRVMCPVFQRLSLSPLSGVDRMTVLYINAHQIKHWWWWQSQCLKHPILGPHWCG